MPDVGEVLVLRPRLGVVGRPAVLLAVAHGRELWEDVETGRQEWIHAGERAERTVGE